MTDSKAMILGCSGLAVTPEERRFYAGESPWGFILFGRNVSSADQIIELVAALRDSVGNPQAPVFIDQEGGRVQRLRPPIAPNYPAGAAIGEIYRRDREAGLRAAWLLSRLHAFDLLRLGITADCLPVLDVPVPGASDVIGARAYGEQPQDVIALGRAAAEGLMSGGVLPVMKHMPGHGRAGVDTHHALPKVDATLDELRSRDFAPFRALNHLPMGMTAHVVYAAVDPDAPATTSARVVEQIIRGEIGFDGLLMSDDSSMKALSGDFDARAARILAAGVDLVLHCNGDMAEMAGIAAGTKPLEGTALRRAQAALAARIQPDGAAEDGVRAEFATHFERAA
jgi:beta-N-acetylhexosaminidase